MRTFKIILPNIISRPSLVLIILFTSCAHVYYSPNSSNVPLFKEKGEGRINAYYVSGSSVSGGEIQGAYSVSDHVGIMANGAFVGPSEENALFASKDDGNGSLIEAGAGYFTPVAKNWVFETYGGLGFGSAANEYASGGDSKVNFTKFFIQPSIGFTQKNVDFGVASKFSFVSMRVDHSSIFTSGDPFNTGELDQIDIENIKSHPSSVLWEPSFFVRFGFPVVKMQLQYTPSVNLNNKTLEQEPGVFSIGISISTKTTLASK